MIREIFIGAGRDRRTRGPVVERRSRRVTAGVVTALAAALLAVPGAGAQEQNSADSHDAKVANDVNATATSNAEIEAGDIVSGHNTGNSVSTADTHEGNIVINAGIFESPTHIDFYIDSGYNDAWADGGYGEATSTGPNQDMTVDREVDEDREVVNIDF